MPCRASIAATTLAAALFASVATLQAFDDAKYPDLSGQWLAVRLGVRGQPAFDPTKSWGLGQQAPLTPEYQKVLEASLEDQRNGGQGNWHPGDACLPPGMPAMMTLYQPMEIIVLPETTYIRIDHTHESFRRIYTDGRDWPKGEVQPTFVGYSIGKWIDQDGDGKYDALEVETRHLKGPRPLDPAGMPTHEDNKSIVKERIYLSKAVPGYLHDEITLIDNAFTRPWTVLKTYSRNRAKYPEWQENVCASENVLVKIGKETYFRGGDGNLMPTRKGQPAPDVRHFQQTAK
jgi:hypothetical protein